MKRSKKIELQLNIEFGRIVLFTFFTSKKLWNQQLNFTFKNAEQKSSHHVNVSRPGWKNLHIKTGQKTSQLVFYPDPALTETAPK